MILPEGLLSPLTDFDVGYTKHNHEARRNEINGCEMRLLDLESDNCKMRQLTLCEKRILLCLVEGDSNKVIARKSDIAEATVKVHIKAILRKIQVQNRTQAAVWGINHAINVWSLGMPEHGGAGPEHKRKFEAAS
jgi:DNA-binding CsgD family transcriptional regulator